MPKKGKKGGKKKGAKKSKKPKEPELTPAEAILTYKINIKEQETEELRFQAKELEEMKERNIERNARLSEERQGYINMLMKKLQEMEAANSEKFTDKPAVIETMKENWRLEKQEQTEVDQLKNDISNTEGGIAATRQEIDHWIEFREEGANRQKSSIRLLRQEIKDSEETFQSIREYMGKKQHLDKNVISTQTNKTIEKHKARATEHAMNQLDKNSKQELVDNEWLRKEAEIHRKEVDRILAEVEELEKQNLQIMSVLFDCRIQDLKFSRDFFMTQFQDDDDLGQGGMVELDLEEVLNPKKPAGKIRPKSAILQAVEDKFLMMTKSLHDEISENEDEDNDDEEFKEPWEQFVFEASKEELMSLGPVEVKMLSLAGERVRLNTPYVPTAEELEAKQWNPDVWPVNVQMLKNV